MCSCGNEIIKPKHDVMQGKIKSCGCKTNLWISQKHRILEKPGTVYNFLRIDKPVFTKEDMGDSEYWCTCLLCGNKIKVKLAYLRSGNTKSCGCLLSYKEFEIINILKENKINFKNQYTFSNLRSERNRKLRFDFGILDKNGQLLGLIEYQGEQHFNENCGNFGKRQREVTDKQKQEYCKINNIPLLYLTKNDNLKEKILCFYNEVM